MKWSSCRSPNQVSWIPLKILEKVQDHPGTELCRKGPHVKEENQIMAKAVVPLGAQGQDREMGKE